MLDSCLDNSFPAPRLPEADLGAGCADQCGGSGTLKQLQGSDNPAAVSDLLQQKQLWSRMTPAAACMPAGLQKQVELHSWW